MCALYALLNHFLTVYAFEIDGSPNIYTLKQMHKFLKLLPSLSGVKMVLCS
jgi:hypothetical protein